MQSLACDLWMMEPNAFRQFAALATRISINAETLAAMEKIASGRSERQAPKNVAVLPVHGPIEARYSIIGELLGMTSAEKIGYQFKTLIADKSVSSVVLDIASPGGMVYGTPELAETIYQARGIKPIIAVANPAAFSGAFWIASAADRIVVTPSGDVGSVGVIAEHVDVSQAMAQKGVKETIIRSKDAPFKAETIDAEPLTDEARQNLQQRADAIHEKFIGALAKFRGLNIEHVRENFGKGRIVDAKAAMKAGMVDQIAPLGEILDKLSAGRIRIASSRVEDDWNAPTKNERVVRRAEAFRALAESPSEN